MIKLLRSLAALGAAVVLVPAQAQDAAPPASAASAPAPVDDALFRALGGRDGIGRLVAEFVPRLAGDPRTSEFFKNVPRKHFEAMLSLKFCEVAGGPCVYTGRSIAEVHHELDISAADFNGVVEVLQDSMDAQGVPFATQNRLLARLAPMHRDIVTVH